MTLTLDEMVSALVAQGVPRDRAERSARATLGIVAAMPDPGEQNAARLEKAEVERADKQMRALGFRVVSNSQPRAAKVTPGIPDRLYLHRARGLAIWWEAKTVDAARTKDGGRSPAQVEFFQDVAAAGHDYATGPARALFDYLASLYPVVWDESGNLVWCHPVTERIGRDGLRVDPPAIPDPGF